MGPVLIAQLHSPQLKNRSQPQHLGMRAENPDARVYAPFARIGLCPNAVEW